MVKSKKSSKKAKTATKATKVTKVAKVVKAVKTTRAKKAPKVVDFKPSRESTPFMTFKITRQTIYWLILTALIFSLALWVLKIQLDTTYILETISFGI